MTDNFIEKEQRRLYLRRIFRRIFLEDWLLKLIALTITFALWFGVTGLREPISRNYEVNLNLNFPSVFVNTNPSQKKITINVTGDKRKIDALHETDLVASVDLTDVKQGDRLVQLTPDNINVELPNGLKINEITPNKIIVKLEKIEEREVQVTAETEGSAADGYEIYSQTVTPAKVRVRGAESFVKSLNSVMTEKINLDNRNADFIAHQVELNVVNPNVTILDGIVDVAFRIGEKRAERIMFAPVKTEHETKKVMVTLYGAHTILENLRVEDLKIELVKSESGELVPQVVLPADVQDKIEVRKVKIS